MAFCKIEIPGNGDVIIRTHSGHEKSFDETVNSALTPDLRL
jgi:hypothetical protein